MMSFPTFVTALRASGLDLRAAAYHFRREWLIQVMEAHCGNQCRAAEELGIHRNTLAGWLAELDLAPDTGRKKACADSRPRGTATRSERAVVNSVRKGGRGESPRANAPAFASSDLDKNAGAFNFSCGSVFIRAEEA